MLNASVECALIGYGYWGPNLARIINNVPQARLRWICDQDPDERVRAKQLYPVAHITEDAQEILADSNVDAVFIATPLSTHAELAMSAIQADKHVFVEKPLASSSHAARRLIGESEKLSRTLMTGHTFLYVPGIRKLKELLESGEIGDVLHVSLSRLSLGPFRRDANVVWDLMPDDVAILLYLFDGAVPNRVRAAGSAHFDPNVVDTASAFLAYGNGTTAELRASWIYPHKIREVTVVGSRKMMIFDDTQPLNKVRVIDRIIELAWPAMNLGEFQMASRYGDTHIPLLDNTEPLYIEICDFIDCIRERRRPLSDGHLSVKVVEQLEAIDESLGPVIARPIPLNSPTPSKSAHESCRRSS